MTFLLFLFAGVVAFFLRFSCVFLAVVKAFVESA